MRLTSARNLLLGWTVAFAALTSVASGQHKPFPDDWFMEGSAIPRRMEGQEAPEIRAEKWIGPEISLKEQRGKIVVIDFWAAWCPPCLRAIPLDVDLHNQYNDKGVVLIGIHDANRDWEKAQTIVKDKRIPFPVALDRAEQGGATARLYKLQFWPTYVVIDRRGIIRAAGLNPDRVHDAVRLLLEEPELAPELAEKKAPFAADLYLPGAAQMEHLRAMEGKPMPALQVQRWIGTPVETSGKVTILHFFSPTMASSLKGLELLKSAKLPAEGVVRVGVCDARAVWDLTKAQFERLSPVVAIAQDKPAEPGKGTSARGLTAGSLPVDFVPLTIVLDQKGIVRAAGINPEKCAQVVEEVLKANAEVSTPTP